MVQRRLTSLLAVLGMVHIASTTHSRQEPSSAETQPAELSVEDEVLANIRNQVVGNHTVGDYQLDEAFLRRVADRIIRSSFEERFRMVVRDQSAKTQEPHGPPAKESNHKIDIESDVRVISVDLTDDELRYRSELVESHPANRCFRAPSLNHDDSRLSIHVPDSDAPPEIRLASGIICKRLARDGFLLTLAQVIQALGPDRFTGDGQEARTLLCELGFPVDLVKYFDTDSKDSDGSVIRFIAHRLLQGKPVEALRDDLASVGFSFQPSHPGFHVATESGEHPPASIRLQLSRGNPWLGPGDGGNLDLASHVINVLSDSSFVISIRKVDAAQFLQSLSAQPVVNPGRLTVITEELEVSQWAQDNMKPGTITINQSQSKLAAVAPRFASRRDDASVFIPGESFLLEGMAQAGFDLIHSPLIFQGGNLLAVRHPATGRRILLIGEAEIHRNTILGLTKQQILDAFRIEFGVDECIVLPSISFHIDYDVTVRAVDGRLVAFVNDEETAVRIILESGLDVLHTQGLLADSDATAADGHLSEGRFGGFLNVVGSVVSASVDQHGRFPLSLAETFSVSEVDSGVGNFQRFLAAMDIAASWILEPHSLPPDPILRSYLQSIQRRTAAREHFETMLRQRGFDVVRIPSFAHEQLSVNTINGVHLPGMYLMPAYGGLYSPVDEAAADSMSRVMGGEVRIVPIRSAESQRRVGAVHCSISLFPAVDS